MDGGARQSHERADESPVDFHEKVLFPAASEDVCSIACSESSRNRIRMLLA
jgi:hypothetical protein